ncbi:MAG TPA: hypothetical protein VM936_14740 [Pyrinomonadaceae bacterium]|nr:hypothetical protein [Pyrinomonadaceae bacterium]
MPQKTFRAAAITSTFLLGLAAVRLAGAAASLEARLADLLVPESEVTLPAAPPLSVEEYETREVYSEVVREMFGGRNAEAQVVIAPETLTVYVCGEGVRTRMDWAEDETLRDYDWKKGRAERISTLPRVAATQFFIERGEFADTFYAPDSGGWPLFYERYPRSAGYVDLSRVGFNKTYDEAFLYASRSCGYLCAEGWHVLLREGPGGWRIIKKELMWVA